jgi:hypothetical protein
VVGRAVEQPARERERLHASDALHVHDLHSLPQELFVACRCAAV